MFRRIKPIPLKKHKKAKGFTLTEVIVASTLLLLGIIPILKALTSSYVSSDRIDRKTQSLFYAQAKLDETKAQALVDFESDYTRRNLEIGKSYYCSIEDESDGGVKQLVVNVGVDTNEDRLLNDEEVLISLATQMAKRF